jgi:hypothetical protein
MHIGLANSHSYRRNVSMADADGTGTQLHYKVSMYGALTESQRVLEGTFCISILDFQSHVIE